MPEKSIERVAVIGAGISGVVSAGHLLATGFDVTVFERNQAAGGIWLYDKRVPIEAQYPCVKPSDVERCGKDDRRGKERQYLLHAPPGPCYDSLTNNVSTPLLRTKLNAWPNGTPSFVNHRVLKEYIQNTSTKAGVDNVTILGALVTRIYKDGQRWHVHWKSLHEDLEDNVSGQEQSAVRLPEAKAQWPSSITHSKSFRSAEGLEGKNVLVIGGGVSSVDIAREIDPVAQNVYQSTRNGTFDVPASLLPKNTTRVEQVASINIIPLGTSAEAHLPITVHLKSGQTLHNIDKIILATGYQMVLPFFPQYTDDRISVTGATDTVLVTDGTQIHNLHQDIFYIPDPTLTFVGIPFYTATFTLFEFQAIAVVAFFTGIARLASREELRKEYQTRLAAKGHGRSFHSLKDEEVEYVRDVMEWVNTGRASHGLPLIEGHTNTWLEEKQLQIERLEAIRQGLLSSHKPSQGPAEAKAAA
ncbi:hypothetical protein N7492_001719 [Penicillium capsulatum]|uniref:FAD dependent oxidoreductase n=1 Tax=Penicillium capsulatum TaxID=69766 RepID=A0A9W9LZZ3_9EURO|nr:hypothetical protein N7492_001719 [Penicillium capsulatum]KAJ6129230.1 hypothetical protein N7512_002010 [Penicillium capsulatum]